MSRYLPEGDAKYVWGLVVGGLIESGTHIPWWGVLIAALGVLFAIMALNYLTRRT